MCVVLCGVTGTCEDGKCVVLGCLTEVWKDGVCLVATEVWEDEVHVVVTEVWEDGVCAVVAEVWDDDVVASPSPAEGKDADTASEQLLFASLLLSFLSWEVHPGSYLQQLLSRCEILSLL